MSAMLLAVQVYICIYSKQALTLERYLRFLRNRLENTLYTNLNTVFHAYYKFGYSVTRILQILIQCYTYTTNLDTVFLAYYKFGYSVPRILQI
jgi:hypothetical protein